MKDWFDSLDSRERQFVSIGAVVAVIALVYGLGWAPFDEKHTELKADVAKWERSLADLRPLRVAVANGYRKRSQPTGSNGIRVEFENVAFDELVLWLGDLGDQYAMHVQAGSFSVGSQVSPGRINASITLERAL